MLLLPRTGKNYCLWVYTQPRAHQDQLDSCKHKSHNSPVQTQCVTEQNTKTEMEKESIEKTELIERKGRKENMNHK